MSSSTFKLHAISQPLAFDVSPSREQLYVASSVGISMFNISNLSTGSPKIIVRYEQPLGIKKLSCSHPQYVALLRNGSVSLWDSQNSLNPIRGRIQGQKNSSLNDFQIASEWNENCLAACTDSSDVLLYDIRSCGVSNKATMPSSQNLSKVDVFQHLLAASTSSSLTVFDMRYMRSDEREAVLNLDLSAFGLATHCWCNSSIIALATHDGYISYLNIHSNERVIHQQLLGVAPFSLLPVPTSQTLFIAASVLERKSPSPDPNASANKLTLKIYTQKIPAADEMPANATTIATLRDSLLGMALGSSGQLIPPYDSGLELLTLSPSAVLHAIKIPDQMLLTRSTAKSSPKGIVKHVEPIYTARDLRQSLLKNDPTNHPLSNFFMSTLKDEVLELQGSIENNELQGIAIVNVDPYAKQVTLIMVPLEEKASTSLPSFPSMRKDSSCSSDFQEDAGVVLIISFPPKFPQEGLPSFTVRPSFSGGRALGLGPEGNALTSELTEIARRYSSSLVGSESAGNKSFLMEVAKCFRWRILQLAFAKPESIEYEELLTLVPSAFPPSGDSTADLLLRQDPNATDGARLDVIEAKSYRIPCPCTSAARFSPIGMLLSFGSTKVVFTTEANNKSTEVIKVSYPRSYADMLLILREEIEQDAASLSDLDEDEVNDINTSNHTRLHSSSFQSMRASRSDTFGSLNDEGTSPMINSLSLEPGRWSTRPHNAYKPDVEDTSVCDSAVSSVGGRLTPRGPATTKSALSLPSIDGSVKSTGATYLKRARKVNLGKHHILLLHLRHLIGAHRTKTVGRNASAPRSWKRLQLLRDDL